jgi:hypothetical protein
VQPRLLYHRITNQILEIDGIQRTSTAISVMELMPPRYDGLISRLSEQESRTSEQARVTCTIFGHFVTSPASYCQKSQQYPLVLQM